MRLNLPNVLTWLRIVLIPVFVAVFYPAGGVVPESWANVCATLIFALAAATDWLDGWVARRFNQTSAFGAFLDPVADKLMVAAALIVLVDLGRVDVAIALVIIGREIAISALREWMATLGEARSVAVAMLGKFKTGFQMAAILFLLYHAPILGLDSMRVGTVLIYIAALLTLVSMGYYLRAAGPVMRR